MLHVILQQCRITASAAHPSYAHRRPIRKNIAGTGERREGSALIKKGKLMTDNAPDPEPTVAFGRWLLDQRDRGDWVDGLADAARTDRTFPKNGDPEAVRAHLRKQQADGDVFQAIDDAEADWQSLSR